MLPREVRPGTTYLLTRRCTQRQFLLRPSAVTNQIVEYCLAVASERTGVQLHAFVAMSNHVHAVATDVEGRLPDFARLQFVAPPQLESLGVADANKRLFAAVSEKVRLARAKIFAERQPFAGAKAVMKMAISRSGATPERIKQRIPRFAICNKVALKNAIARWRGFQHAYREALRKWKLGERCVRFPHGTWLLRRHHCARCGPPLEAAG